MHRSFVQTDPQNHQGENIWFTPSHIVESLGPFDMDVCSVSYRPFDIASDHIEHDKGDDSFKFNWNGFVWMNPPYGKEIEPFIKKFKEHGNGIALVFARMGTPWMQDYLRSGLNIFFLRKRINFIDKNGVRAKANAGTDSCLLIAGEKAKQRVVASGLDGVLR